MTDQPTGAVRELLRAVLEALDIHAPATVGDGEVHDRLLADRAMHAVIALRGVLQDGDDPGWSADYLRARLTEHPTTGYRADAEGSGR
ncbi:hypothetical protein ABZS86_02425 [Streptomyces sp. NPDC005355]|uniref:hypothetical protein n=1 Tax=Streptomyces sp. NPDC005355 TaxID=3157038 RepID=UPI0033B20944